MAGGIGSRFWPVSTRQFPKQFHDLLGSGQSLLQTTFSRLSVIIPKENILILTNSDYLNITLQQLPEITESQIILEPTMRNTAPCILLSALKIQKKNEDAVMLVAPSDHWIEDEKAFAEDVRNCFNATEKDNKLITLGITPTFPNTGYGYIEIEKEGKFEIENNSLSSTGNQNKIQKVKQFREKPDYETAKQFLTSGNFLWNAGIFIWSVKSIVAAFENNLPIMNALFSEGLPVYNTSEEKKFIDENYEKAENISVDYGILEKAKNVYIKKASFDWNDLGTWGALHDKLDKDEKDNSVVRAKTLLANASGNIISTSKEKLVIVDGLKDYIIVDKDDVLLLYPKTKEQEIKQLLQEVSKKFGKNYS